MTILKAAMTALVLATTAAPAMAQETVTHGPYTITTFDPADYSQVPTRCDKLASHPEDPYAVWPGRERPEINLTMAVEACKAAVAADPENPRLNYLAGRTLGYSERGEEAVPYRTKSVNAGYPQSLFVIGYIHTIGLNAEKDVCLGAELMRLSGLRGRFAGQVGFPHNVMNGAFDDCPVRKDKAEMIGMLEAAKPGSGYYENLLLAELKRRLAEMD